MRLPLAEAGRPDPDEVADPLKPAARLVLDTHIVVSGLLSPLGPSARLMDLAQRGEIRLLYDDRIFQEYREVLRRPHFGFSSSAVDLFLEFVQEEGERLAARSLPPGGTDPSDQPFLEVAVSGQADLLVTGNLRHYPRSPAGKIRIVSPREALRWLIPG